MFEYEREQAEVVLAQFTAAWAERRAQLSELYQANYQLFQQLAAQQPVATATP